MRRCMASVEVEEQHADDLRAGRRHQGLDIDSLSTEFGGDLLKFCI
jgi:hypothetical protein